MMKVVWLNQRTELQQLAVGEGLPAEGRRGKLRDALAFGEMLTLVSDCASTSRLIHEDPRGALAFLDFLNECDETIATAEGRPSSSKLESPFHELADLAVEFLTELKTMSPEKFE